MLKGFAVNSMAEEELPSARGDTSSSSRRRSRPKRRYAVSATDARLTASVANSITAPRVGRRSAATAVTAVTTCFARSSASEILDEAIVGKPRILGRSPRRREKKKKLSVDARVSVQ